MLYREIDNKNNTWYLYIISIVPYQKCIYKSCAFTFKLYYTYPKFIDPNRFLFDMMCHCGSIVKLVIENIHCYRLKNEKILLSNKLSCIACSQKINH